MSKRKELLIVGRNEAIDFPDLGLFGINAKIDTGAYTASLHCYDIREKDGVLYFKLLEPTQNNFNVPDIKFTDYSQTNVKSSFGETEKRYVIKTKVEIGGKRLTTFFTLTDRGTMRYPVLIGRRLLNKRFMVDVSIENSLSIDEDNNE